MDFQCIGSDLHPSAAFLGGADGRMDKNQGVEALLESRISPGNRVGLPACFKGLDVVSKVPVKIGKCQGHAFSVADGDA